MNDFLPHQELSPHLWCMHYASRTGKKMEATEQACTQPHLGAWLRVHAFILQRWCRREGLWVEVGPRQRCRSPSPRCTCYTNTEEEAWRPKPNTGEDHELPSLCAAKPLSVRVYNLLLFPEERAVSLQWRCHENQRWQCNSPLRARSRSMKHPWQWCNGDAKKGS
jgi:hypothetical protein